MQEKREYTTIETLADNITIYKRYIKELEIEVRELEEKLSKYRDEVNTYKLKEQYGIVFRTFQRKGDLND